MQIDLEAMFKGDNPFKASAKLDKTGHDFDDEWSEPH
jgi:hypothetical protein